MSNAAYEIEIVARDGMGQIPDDWHAKVTRISDGKTIYINSRRRSRLIRGLSRTYLDGQFSDLDKRTEKLSRREVITR